MRNFSDLIIWLLVIMIPVVMGILRKRRRQSGSTEVHLNRLALLSEDTVKTKNNKTANIEEEVEQCINSVQASRSYSGRTFIRDLTANDLKKYRYICQEWRFDYSAPNAIHVSQKFMDIELGWLYDEWITINEDHYQNAGIWMYKKRSDTHESYLDRNKILKIDNLLSILKDEKPIKVVECSYKGVPYMQLIYSLDTTHPCVSTYGFDQDYKYITAHLWINQKTSMLAKGSYIFDGKVPGTFRGDFQQVYTNYDASFEVKPPPWLNVEPNEDGEDIIVNTNVPIVRHY